MSDFIKTKDSAEAMLYLDELDKVKEKIKFLPVGKSRMYVDWLITKSDMVLKELMFSPSDLKSYSRGEVVCVDLGYNVGNEYGGLHYVLVLRDSSKTNPVLNAIPLTSFKISEQKLSELGVEKEDELTDEQIETIIHRDSLYLGNINGLPSSEKKSIALVNQIITISKIRIKSPKSPRQPVVKVSNAILDAIDEKVFSLYFG